MQEDTPKIKKKIIKKLQKDVVSIFKKELKYDDHFYIAGGALESIIRNVPCRDYDIFFKTHGRYKKLANAMMCHRDFVCENINDNVTTFSYKGKVYDLIHREFYVNKYSVICDFDFICCAMCYCSNDKQEITGTAGIQDVLRRELNFNKNASNDNFINQSTLSRIRKYINAKEYKITPGAILDLLIWFTNSQQAANIQLGDLLIDSDKNAYYNPSPDDNFWGQA